SCSFSAGTHKDLGTGLSYNYNGFSVDEVLLADADNNVMSNNEVELNSEISIVVQGLSNYELKDDKAYPGLMMQVLDKQGVAIIDEADLFAGSNGYSTSDASIVRGTVTVGDPMVSGQTYLMKIRVWDKNKPENELTAEVDFVVK
ncbi:MAG TPA: hypothetical protein DIW27_06575, partial [Cytophagales bacterium]|nr:hypothetical protein [Cytophagales bacterium]